MGMLFRKLTVAAALLLSAACTTSQTEVPGLAGPSELALSVRMTAIPDSISQDGASQSSVVVTAFDAAGKPCANLPVRMDMGVGGSIQDFGTLSARNIVTGSDGRATTTYTAPPPPPPLSGGSGNTVIILATPSSSVNCNSNQAVGNFDATNRQQVAIRLVAPGVILPPAGTPTARFSITPTPMIVNVPSTFDASASTAGSGATSITTYSWNFGDGSTGSGKTTSHAFSSVGTFNVTLTVTNDRGLSASTTTPVVPVTSTLAPDWTVSPDAPLALNVITFDASKSTVPAGATIVDYAWSFGDSTLVFHTTSPRIQHTYLIASDGQYNVTLTIKDNFGNTASDTKGLVVQPGGEQPAGAKFTISPTPGIPNQPVTFDGSASQTGAGGGNIINFQWDFGDGTGILSTGPPPAGAVQQHVYSKAGTYTIVLTVTTDRGNSGTISHTLLVQ